MPASNPALVELAANGILYEIREYDPSNEKTVFPVHLSGEDVNAVVKTLILRGAIGPICAIISYPKMLHFRKVAKAAGLKDVNLMPLDNIINITGYMAGGVSPFGMSTKMPVFIDRPVTAFKSIYVNGGRAGLQLTIPVTDVIERLNWVVCDISKTI